MKREKKRTLERRKRVDTCERVIQAVRKKSGREGRGGRRV